MVNVKTAESTTNQTLAAWTVERLREDILNGAHAPGSPLRMAALQTEYEVGNTPLREALFHLASEGLVELSGGRGFRVAPMSIEEIVEVTEVRKWLERLALRESLKNGDTHWEARIIAAYHLVSSVHQTDPGWDTLNREFHDALASACTFTVLHRFQKHLYDVTSRYRKLAWRIAKTPEAELDLSEHKQLLDAALARDYEKCAEIMDAHCDSLVKIIVQVLGPQYLNKKSA